MVIEDARELTLVALEKLENHKDDLDLPHLATQSLPDFLASTQKHRLTRKEKETIVDQAILMLDQIYAHLPFKRARYAINPVQRLRLLRAQLPHIRELDFHTELLNTFLELRDAHTFYGLPEPYQGAVAFLPFTMACFHERGKRRFIVTHVLDGFDHPYFKPEAEILFWNGTPVTRALERLGERVPGGNRASRFARGLRSMTVLPLSFSLPPDEFWVTLQYRFGDDGDERGITVPWTVGAGFGHRIFVDETPSSICGPVAAKAHAHRVLWTREELKSLKQLKSLLPEPAPDNSRQSLLPNLFEFQYSGGASVPGSVNPDSLFDPAHPTKHFGYLRIKSFEHDSDDIVDEFARILNVMRVAAPDGLILDVRGNPGGSVQAAERILQLLTPKQITPAAFHLINTPLTQHIAERLREILPTHALATRAELQPWVRDILDSVASGSVLTEGRPLTDPDLANSTGQLYQGPVTLLIDAIAYSATDVFSAGFQDHGIGPIIGVDENTGGGGANRWLHDELVTKLHLISGLPFVALPGGATFGVAIRRCLRTGANAGIPLEDIGVRRDIEYHITRRDLHQQDRDLLLFACAELARRPVYKLEIVNISVLHDSLNVTMSAANLERIECWLDDHPQCAVPVTPGEEQLFSVPLLGLPGDPPKRLTIKGFVRNQDGALELAVAASTNLEASTTLEATGAGSA